MDAAAGAAGNERPAYLRGRVGGAAGLAGAGPGVADLAGGARRSGEATEVLLADERALVAPLSGVAVAVAPADLDGAALAADGARMVRVDAQALHAKRAEIAVGVGGALVAPAGAQRAQALDGVAELGDAALARFGAADALAVLAELAAGQPAGAVLPLLALGWRRGPVALAAGGRHQEGDHQRALHGVTAPDGQVTLPAFQTSPGLENACDRSAASTPCAYTRI